MDLMHYLKIDEIKYLQVDHNSVCNLRCPQCARTLNGNTIPDLPALELDIEDYEKIITPNLETIMFCGNYGDVSVSNTFLPSIEWLITKKQFGGKIIVTSHGSARDESWWKNLGKLLGSRGKVNFSIDGLGDTNHTYRINSNFDKIIRNAKAFISAGGNARWDFLVFRHNEHQIDDAISLAKELGFQQFQIKLTNRFVDDRHYRNITTPNSSDLTNVYKKLGYRLESLENKPLHDGSSQTHNMIKKYGTWANYVKTVIDNGDATMAQEVITKKSKYQILSPENIQLQGSGLSQNQNIIKKYGTWENYVNQTNIKCKWKPNGQIFVDFEARVWPCTWVASGMHHHGNNVQKIQIHKILDKYGHDFNSLKHHSFQDILEHRFFSSDFCQSWKGKMSSDVPKLLACGRTCGTDYEFSSAYGSNKMMINLHD